MVLKVGGYFSNKAQRLKSTISRHAEKLSMENKNILIAFVLMLVVWMGVNFFFPANPVSPQGEDSVESNLLLGDPSLTTSETAVEDIIVNAGTLSIPRQERQILVNTGKFDAVFTSVGGGIKSLQLPGYMQTAADDSLPVALVSASYPSQTTLRSKGLGEFDLAEDAFYAISEEQTSVVLGAGEEKEIVFTSITPRGLKIEKAYRLKGDAFDFELEVRATNLGADTIRGATSLSLVHPWDASLKKESDSFVGSALYDGDKVHIHELKDIAKQSPIYGSDSVWIAFQRKYFLSAVVAQEQSGDKFRIGIMGELVENSIDAPFTLLVPGQSISNRFVGYFGPRDLDVLQQVGYDLDKAVDFGFFGVIARPLLSVLKFFYSYVGNWGIAIILLTCIIKLLFWPLTQKSYKSMKSMQSLQPEMQKLREKYKNNKEQLNKEIMALYRTNRVNPMGGCLPMIVQIPVFFALYKVLLGTIALRHAPFVFWIQDLSVKDPYYITPIIMGITMFIQQRMTPSTMDPVQAKVFMFMPIIFTFMFLNFPSGLVLYWMVNNLLTILQQWQVNRTPKLAA